MFSRKLRNYEVSIWTLQDSFITVLKPFNLERKGLIQNPKFIRKDDGTEEFSFSIPMHIIENNVSYDNPIWYNVINGNLMENLRKIKIIFNKNQADQKVFEQVIVSVSERHENKETFCDVKCEGLAFHELGKVGYKISLNSDDYIEENLEWFKGGQVGNEPVANLQYWNDKVFKDRTDWEYEIQMDWSMYVGEGFARNKVYEDEYVASWAADNNGKVKGTRIKTAQEKYRLVDLEESNIYNLTQELAKTFGVFCRYEYEHDKQFHIIGKKVIYYNNFLAEYAGAIDLTYKYNTNELTREIDGKDIITKMFVRSVENEYTDSGLISIMNVDANKTKEDYILNFEYLHDKGIISEEQYADIQTFEEEMFRLNTLMMPLEDQITLDKSKLPDVEAAITTATNAIQLDQERINEADDLLHSITGGTGVVEVTASRPDTAIPLLDSETGKYYIRISQLNKDIVGLMPDTIHIYRTYVSSTSHLDNEVTGWMLEYDEYNDVVKIIGITPNVSGSNQVYLIYNYSPRTQYQKVKDIWLERLTNDEETLANKTAEQTELNTRIETNTQLYNEYLEEKKQKIAEFEMMMGPALREGYWQPEDYADYGDMYLDEIQVSNTITYENDELVPIAGSTEYLSFIWDDELFDSEQKLEYKLSAAETPIPYPCIDLSDRINIRDLKDNLNTLSFSWFGTEVVDKNDFTKLTSLPVHSKCQYGFAVKDGTNTVIPVLILTGVDTLRSESITDMQTSECKPVLGVVHMNDQNVLTRDVIVTEPSIINLRVNANDSYHAVYPRLKIDTLKFKNAENEYALTYAGDALKEFEDYYTLTRTNCYYTTIKPEVFIRNENWTGAIAAAYTISNADTVIYLDAVKVLKENAYPKVSYSLKVLAANEDLIENAYNLLGRIANINDSDLKLRNVQGYISEVTLDLDSPKNDEIVIQNYRNKFEDLFSTIVAQTEQMTKSGYAISLAGMALGANGGLTPQALNATLNQNSDILDEYLAKKFDDRVKVSSALREIFTEASNILVQAQQSVNSVYNLNQQNASILSGFAASVNGSGQTIYNSTTPPLSPQPGDIWNELDASGNVVSTNIYLASGGWNRTYDGSIKSITGAKMDVNAQEGVIDIAAQSRVSLRAGSNIYIASDDVQITGNSAVNVGSDQWINIVGGAGVNIISNGALTTNADGRINNATYNSSGKITEIGGQAAVSALQVGPEGVYIGSTGTVTMYSGGVGSAASAELSNERILFGVSNTAGNTTAAEFTDNYIIFSAGSQRDSETDELLLATQDITFNEDLQNPIAGVKITEEKIGLATGSGTNRAVVLIGDVGSNNHGVVIGAGSDPETSGTFVKILPQMFEVGSQGNVRINANNLKIQTDATDDQTHDATIFALGASLNSNNPQVNFLCDEQGNVSIRGNVTATNFLLDGSTATNNFNTAVSNSTAISNINAALSGIGTDISTLQSQIDGEIDTWFYSGAPSSSTAPENEWNTDTIRDRHLGDVYYDISPTGGRVWRYAKNVNDEYVWQEIHDTATTAALAAAAQAQSTADGKVATYYAAEKANTTPVEPDISVTTHAVGDLWVNTSQGNTLYRYNGSTWTIAETIVIEYAAGNSSSTAPTTGWSTSSPSWVAGQYIWQRTAITQNGTVTYSNVVCIQAAGARSVEISGGQIFTIDANNNNAVTPATITLTATCENLDTSNLQWSYKNGNNWTPIGTTGSTTYTVDPSGAYYANDATEAQFKAAIGNYNDIYTVAKISNGVNGTNGTNGTNGADAYTILLSNENHTFQGDTTGALTNNATTCNVVVYKGATQIAITNITWPNVSGLSITKDVAGNTLTIIASPTYLDENDELQVDRLTTAGSFNMSIMADGKTFTKTFSYSIALVGADGAPGTNGTDGRSINSSTVLYYLETNGTAPTIDASTSISSSSTDPNQWTEVIPTWVSGGHYYKCEKYTWSSGTSPTFSTPCIDWGITTANATATTASTNAAAAKAVTDAYTASGLLSNYTWGNTTYPIALTSTENMLIGATTGLTIAKSANAGDGAAVTIDSSGIALNAATISLVSNSGGTTNTISLGGNGINLGTSGKLILTSSDNISITSGNFQIDNSGNVTVSGTLTAGAGSSLGGWITDTGRLYSGSNNTFVALDSGQSGTANTDYAIWAGDPTPGSAEFSVTRGGVLHATSAVISGTLTAGSGSVIGAGSTIGGWSVDANRLYSGTGTNTVALDSGTANMNYALWAGKSLPEETINGTTTYAPFSVQRDGSVIVTKLYGLNSEGTSLYNVNIGSSLWKLYYSTVKANGLTSSVEGNVVTISLETTGGTLTTNFTKPATTVDSFSGLSGSAYSDDETGDWYVSGRGTVLFDGGGTQSYVSYTAPAQSVWNQSRATAAIVSGTAGLTENITLNNNEISTASRNVNFTYRIAGATESKTYSNLPISIDTSAVYSAGCNTVTLSRASITNITVTESQTTISNKNVSYTIGSGSTKTHLLDEFRVDATAVYNAGASSVVQRSATSAGTVTLANSDTGNNISKTTTVSYSAGDPTSSVPITINAANMAAASWNSGADTGRITSNPAATNGTIALAAGGSATIYAQVKRAGASAYTTKGTITVTAPSQRTANGNSGTITLARADTSTVYKDATITYDDGSSTPQVSIKIQAGNVYAAGYDAGWAAAKAEYDH